MFTTESYFIREINIPSGKNTGLSDSINRYEPEILECLLGYELYKALIADLDVDGLPQTQRFIDLVNGAEFDMELNGITKTLKWNGFVNDELISLIAYHVYYQHRNNYESFNTGNGQAKSLHENAESSDFLTKYVQIQNLMVNLYGDIPHPYGYFSANSWFDQDNYIHYDFNPSAYNFLLANKTSYPEWYFKPIQKQNQFGI